MSKIKPCLDFSKDEEEAALLGQKIIDSSQEALVVYKNKVWPVKDLLEHLAQRANDSEKSQCKPNAGCLFRYYDYMEHHVEKVKKQKR